MELIHAIEVRYFRSIHSLRLENLSDLAVLAGRNDSGKSNVLKALNLFFNAQTDWQTPLEFYRDFNIRRLEEVRRETVKGRQYISVKVTFNRGDRFHNTLPPRFSVTRSWYRDSDRYDQKDDLESPARMRNIKSLEYARRSLTQFLNNVRYEYIPAIKDARVFEHVVNELQRTLYAADTGLALEDMMSRVGETVSNHVQSLNDDFEEATGIRTKVALPKTLEGVYRISINTSFSPLPDYAVNLDLRGDGIRTRYLPSILNYVALASKKLYVWGFEEPENSLEYRLAAAMAKDFVGKYCGPSQVIVTSHSPAFIALRSESNVCAFRVLNDQGQTEAIAVPRHEVPETMGNDELANDLGLMAFQEQVHQEYTRRLQALERQRAALKELEQEAQQQTMPRLLTEGKTDAAILRVAWKKLRPKQRMPFTIDSCDIAPDDHGGRAGASVLRLHLEGIRPDHPWMVTGVFDHDQEGIEQFSKLRHFEEVPDHAGVKAHVNGRAFAVLLPVPPKRERIAQGRLLSIEYYFSDRVLNNSRTPDGRGLVFRPVDEKRVVGGQVIETYASSEWRQIDDGKTPFVEEIVPTLEPQEFSNFTSLFRLLTELIAQDSAKAMIQTAASEAQVSEGEPMKRSLWPLPGGDYYDSLLKILRHIGKKHIATSELEEWFLRQFPRVTKPALVPRYLRVPCEMGLMSLAGGVAGLTPIGRAVIDNPSTDLVFSAATQRILGFAETLSIIQRSPGLTIGQIQKRLEQAVDVKWESSYQVTWRLRWLKSLSHIRLENNKWYPL